MKMPEAPQSSRPESSEDPGNDWQIVDDEVGQRVDRWLAQRLGKTRNQVQRWITEGRLTINQRPAKASTSLQSGDQVSFEPPSAPPDPGLIAEPGTIELLFEDEHLLVVNKPAGLAVHPGAGREHGTLANFLLHRYPQIAGVGGPGRPGIVHRLDIDTTGALIIALNEPTYLALAQAFAERQIRKTYIAIAYGCPKDSQGTVDLPLGRHPQDRKRMTVRREGRASRTHYRVLETAAGISCLELDLETGRTHQIRVHLKALGHPLIGDPVYGEARWRGLPKKLHRTLKSFERPALHAWRLVFEHPHHGQEVSVEAPVPLDLAALWNNTSGQPWP